MLSKGEYTRLPNIAPDPLVAAQAPRERLLELSSQRLLDALVHSHPNGPNCPSEQDMRTQMSFGVPGVIVSCSGDGCLKPFAWGDTLEPAPLIGRGFQHGVTDCYALVRDYFRLEQGVVIPEFPRSWEWWLNGQTLYLDGFARAGFELISEREAQEGDCVMMQVGGRNVTTPNHAGVLVGHGLFLHHATGREPWDPTRLSRREPLSRWRPYITHWLRRTP